MELRIAVLATAALSFAALPAQAPEAQGKPAADPPAPAAGEPAQDPDRPEPTPAERLAELQQQKQDLEREIEFVKTRVAQSKELLRQKLTDRDMDFRSIDAGKAGPSGPIAQPVARREARLMTAKELDTFGADVLLTVDGRPVLQSDFSALRSYLDTLVAPDQPQDVQQRMAESRDQRAMLELMRIETTIANAQEAATEAELTIGEALAEIRGGADFAQVAKKFAQGPLAEDAKVVITRNCPFGLLVEKAAFATEEGQTTPVVRGSSGYVVVKVEERKEGETPLASQVHGRMLMVPYHPDPAELDRIRASLVLGQVALALRDKAVIHFLPPQLRPAQVIDPNQEKEAIDLDAGHTDAEPAPPPDGKGKEPDKKGGGKQD